MDSIGTGLIAGLFTIVGAVLSSFAKVYVERHGFPFTSHTEDFSVTGQGHAKNRWTIDQAGTLSNAQHIATYELTDGTLKRAGARASINAKVKMMRPDGTVTVGRIKGRGPVINGWAYLTYRNSEAAELGDARSYTGVCVIQMLTFGDLRGYWMAQNPLDESTVAIGEVVLRRKS